MPILSTEQVRYVFSHFPVDLVILYITDIQNSNVYSFSIFLISYFIIYLYIYSNNNVLWHINFDEIKIWN